MRKGKYIDYTILLACLSKMPDQQQNKDEFELSAFIDTTNPDQIQKDKTVKVFEPEPA